MEWRTLRVLGAWLQGIRDAIAQRNDILSDLCLAMRVYAAFHCLTASHSMLLAAFVRYCPASQQDVLLDQLAFRHFQSGFGPA